jgi:hypothetical protein
MVYVLVLTMISAAHFLVQGALALGDAITQGTPLRKELELLMQAISGLGDDELVEMAAMSLPEDALKEGIWTQNQLQEELIRDTLTFLLQSEV